jgi:hypothetical protein
MIYGFDKNKFYIDFISCQEPCENFKQEHEKRARKIADENPKRFLSLSGGLDSQAVLHSFITQDISIETVFFYCPTYNDNEYEQIKILDKKYGIKTRVIDLDPLECRDEIEQLSIELDLPGKNHLLQRKFLSYLPRDYTFIQMLHDPYVYTNPTSKNKYFCVGYYWDEISRKRALDSLGRTGTNIIYGDSPEMKASVFNDPIFNAALNSYDYFGSNGIEILGRNIKTLDIWDYYAKPLLYGHYWKDSLIYFPKFQGFERISYLNEKTKKARKYLISIPYVDFVNFLNTPNSIKKRIYENVPYTENNAVSTLSTEYDKTGNKLIIRQTDNIQLGAVYPFILNQIEKLYVMGLRKNLEIWPDNKSVIYAEIDGQIVGVIVYNTELEKQNNLIWLVLGAVDEKYQNQGIYSIMRKHFEILAKNMNFKGVGSLIHKDNKIAMKSAQNLGGNTQYNYVIKLFK